MLTSVAICKIPFNTLDKLTKIKYKFLGDNNSFKVFPYNLILY